MDERRTFPIMGSLYMDKVPWAFIEPHEVQAMRNHYQSLPTIADRGGLSVCEALAVVEGRDYTFICDQEAAAFQLINKVRGWLASSKAGSGG